MGQFFTDDIDALLKSGHGDSARLSKIKAEFTSTKLVSIDDRKYVEGLISRYLHPQDVTPKPERPIESQKRIVPPPPPPRNPPPTMLEIKQQKPKQEKPIPKLDGKIKLRNIVIAVCAVVFAVLVVSFVAMNQDVDVVPPPVTKSLEVDALSYALGDIISISGKTKDSTSIVRLAINNPSNQEIWSETVTVKPSHLFSTLVIAGGDGWTQAGKYTLTVTYSGTTESLTFDFTP